MPDAQHGPKEGPSADRSVVVAAPVAELRLDHILLAVRRFADHELRLKGRPDGLATAFGALEPVEIKSHRQGQRSDRIELAFYWLLLAPYRTRAADPAGWVFLRQPDGTHRRERVSLSAELITETAGYADRVWAGRLSLLW